MSSSSPSWSIPVPTPIRRVFDSFPLLVLPPNPLPARCPSPSSTPSLYVFTTAEDAAARKPSFNPACLKWQTYLRLCGVEYKTIPSNNHASPSGSLPFLIPYVPDPTASPPGPAPKPVPASGLAQWARDHGRPLKECNYKDPEVQAFTTLLDTRIRDAWLYSLYLEPQNFTTITTKQYCTSSSGIINYFLAREYRQAAHAELCKSRPGGVLKSDDIYADADAAFTALATLLIEQQQPEGAGGGGGDWFFGSQEPGLFDAAVFSYTHLILTLPWHPKAERLAAMVRKHEVLVEHEQRVWKWTSGRVRSRSKPQTPRR